MVLRSGRSSTPDAGVPRGNHFGDRAAPARARTDKVLPGRVMRTRSFFEFFAGGGMVRAGLGGGWSCAFANDIDPQKAAAYRENWGAADLFEGDIRSVTPEMVPGCASLAWASFPCQDLSLAGAYAGLGAPDGSGETRSGAFWPFYSLVTRLAAQGRAPDVIVLENVPGVLSSNAGRDFAAIGQCLADLGYRFGALIVDAAHFLPQSRPRVFVIAAQGRCSIPERLKQPAPERPWHPQSLIRAYQALSLKAQEQWVWWRLPVPPPRQITLPSLISAQPVGVQWHSPAETSHLISIMNPRNAAKLATLKAAGGHAVRTIYRRTREGVLRAEMRDDAIAGCLRTPGGGSSKQFIVVVEGDLTRSRLLSAREAARLMGLPDSFALPSRENDAYRLAGDGVAVPVVRYLAAELLEPLLSGHQGGRSGDVSSKPA